MSVRKSKLLTNNVNASTLDDQLCQRSAIILQRTVRRLVKPLEQENEFIGKIRRTAKLLRLPIAISSGIEAGPDGPGRDTDMNPAILLRGQAIEADWPPVG
jgi:hypothetical protein